MMAEEILCAASVMEIIPHENESSLLSSFPSFITTSSQLFRSPFLSFLPHRRRCGLLAPSAPIRGGSEEAEGTIGVSLGISSVVAMLLLIPAKGD